MISPVEYCKECGPIEVTDENLMMDSYLFHYVGEFVACLGCDEGYELETKGMTIYECKRKLAI